MLRSRVLTSFLREYADSQYSSENLAFIQAELTFRDNFKMYEKQNNLKEEVFKLFDEYIDDEKSTTQICLTSDEYAQAIKIRDDEANYNRCMFEPFTSNPRLTVQRDIFPRFRNSPYYKEMRDRVRHPVKAYLQDIVIERPSILDKGLTDDIASHDFTLEEILEDRELSNVFLEYLERQLCGENLKCIMAIQDYKARHGKTDVEPSETKDRAFAIYFSFLQPGSPDEVSVESYLRHDIGGSIARELPSIGLFDRLLRSLTRLLRQQNFEGFRKSTNWADLNFAVRDMEAKRKKKSSQLDGSSACIIA